MRFSYWYQYILMSLCDFCRLWNWPLSGAFVFHKHILLYFLWWACWYENMNLLKRSQCRISDVVFWWIYISSCVAKYPVELPFDSIYMMWDDAQVSERCLYQTRTENKWHYIWTKLCFFTCQMTITTNASTQMLQCTM